MNARQVQVPMLPLPQLNDENELPIPAGRIAVSTLDDCGKLADRSTLRYLGWTRGQPITLGITEGVVNVSEKRGSGHVIEARGYLRLPAEIRTCARINRNDRLLLLAVRDSGILLIYPSVWVVVAMRSFIPNVWQQR